MNISLLTKSNANSTSEAVVAVKGSGLRSIPLYLFAAMHRFSQGRSEFFGVPPELLTAIGRRIELKP
jgi:hypothetical protein